MSTHAPGTPKASAAASMKPVEIDPDSGAETFQLTPADRPCINIYGEQPYSSADSTHIAVEIGAHDGRDAALAFVDLRDGQMRQVIAGKPQFPAFHAWGEYLYCKQAVGDAMVLRRFDYHTLKAEDVLTLPDDIGPCSYGTVSQDHRYYAVSATMPGVGGRSRVYNFDLATGERSILIDDARYLFKHEQFSRDGRNRVMIQGNLKPPEYPTDTTPAGWKHWPQVHLGMLEIGRQGMRRFAADAPHTPRPTGHEAWIGTTSSVFFSTGTTAEQPINLWTADAPENGDASPPRAVADAPRGAHVSVSRCGRFWLVDDLSKPNQPFCVGCFATGRWRRVVETRSIAGDTPWGNQWSHTHPYFTADNAWIIFTSIRSGLPQVYGARLAAGFLDNLAAG